MLKPARIHKVVVGDAVYLSPHEFPAHLFHWFGGNACPNPAAFDNWIFEYNGSRGDDTTGLHQRVIHHNGAHANQYIVFEFAAMH